MSTLIIKHNYEANLQAALALRSLGAELSGYNFASPLAGSCGSTRAKLEELLSELEQARVAIAQIVDKTRQILCDANPAFAEADATAAEMIRESISV
jgi:hypothetical protein